MNYSDVITIEPGKRGGKPCIRGLRITLYDVLEYLASGMSHSEIWVSFLISQKRTFAPVLRTPLTASAKPTFPTCSLPAIESTNKLSSRPSDWIGFANPITRGGTCCFRPGAITDIRRLSKTNSRFLDFAGPFARE